MAKRYVETKRWSKAWFRELGAEGRDIWNWLHDNCDPAGVWEVDFKRFSFDVGFEVDMDRVRAVFGDRIYDLGNGKLWLTRFISFQYTRLSSKNRGQLGIMKQVVNFAKDLPSLDEETTALIEAFESLIRGSNGAQPSLTRGSSGAQPAPLVMVTVTEDGNGNGNGDGNGKERRRNFKPDLEAIYARYPRKEGKSIGLKKLNAALKTESDFQDCMRALTHFLAHHKRQQTSAEYVPYFKSWATEWRDWLDPNHGKTTELFGRIKTQLADLELPPLPGVPHDA